MISFNYNHAYDTLADLKKQAAKWTNDMRGLNRVSNVVFDALFKLYKYDDQDHSVKMTKLDQDNIVGCLEIVSSAAQRAEGADCRVLATQTTYVLNYLNILFEKEGLEPITSLHNNP